jgi:hypothetical protein
MKPSHRRHLLRAALLGSCALAASPWARAQSRREQMMEARTRPAGFRLAAQRIEWLESPELKIRIARRDYSPAISEGNRQVAQRCVQDMLGFMRKDAEGKVRAALASAKALGDAHVLRLQAVSGDVSFSGNTVEWAGSGIGVAAEVLDAAGQSLWKETLQIDYTISAFSRQTAATAEIVEVLVNRLMQRMREVDLIGR